MHQLLLQYFLSLFRFSQLLPQRAITGELLVEVVDFEIVTLLGKHLFELLHHPLLPEQRLHHEHLVSSLLLALSESFHLGHHLVSIHAILLKLEVGLAATRPQRFPFALLAPVFLGLVFKRLRLPRVHLILLHPLPHQRINRVDIVLDVGFYEGVERLLVLGVLLVLLVEGHACLIQVFVEVDADFLFETFFEHEGVVFH